MALKALKSTGDGVNQCRTEINVKTEMRVLDRGCCQTVWRFTCGGFRVSLHYSALLCAALQLLVLMEARCFLTYELPRKRKAAASFNGTFRRNKKKWRDEFSEFRAKASLTFEELDECGNFHTDLPCSTHCVLSLIYCVLNSLLLTSELNCVLSSLPAQLRVCSKCCE